MRNKFISNVETLDRVFAMLRNYYLACVLSVFSNHIGSSILRCHKIRKGTVPNNNHETRKVKEDLNRSDIKMLYENEKKKRREVALNTKLDDKSNDDEMLHTFYQRRGVAPFPPNPNQRTKYLRA